MKRILFAIFMCMGIVFANAQLIKNDFLNGYSVGDVLEIGTYSLGTSSDTPRLNQWSGAANQTAGTVSPLIVAPLTYSGYAESGKDFAAQLALLASGASRTSGYTLASNSTYGSSGGSYYLAFMVNFSQVTSSTALTDFFAFDQTF